MTDTTTIEITHEQKDELDDIGTEYEPYKATVARLIDSFKDDG